MKSRYLLIFSFLLVLTLAGCSMYAPSTQKDVTITSYNWGFAITGDDIVAGDTVTVTHKSDSGTHGFSIPGLNINARAIKPGEVDSFEFIAGQAGEYQFFCNTMCGSGHHSMRSTLIIGE